MSPLAEPDVKFSLIRLFRSTSSTSGQGIETIYLRRLWAWSYGPPFCDLFNGGEIVTK